MVCPGRIPWWYWDLTLRKPDLVQNCSHGAKSNVSSRCRCLVRGSLQGLRCKSRSGMSVKLENIKGLSMYRWIAEKVLTVNQV